MAVTYPREPLGYRVRVALGADLTERPDAYDWTDITEDVSFRKTDVFTIACGSQDEAQQSDSSLGLVIRNHRSAYFDGAGRYTSDNANSDLWPHFDIGLPIEFSVDVGDGVWHVLAVQFLGDSVVSWPGGSQWLALTTCTWGGLLRRLQRRKGVKSSLFRALTTVEPALRPNHYWPIEQAGPGTTRTGSLAPSPVHAATTAPMRCSSTVLGTELPPPSSNPLPLWTGNGQLSGAVTNDGNSGSANGTPVAWTLGFIFRASVAQTSGTVAALITLACSCKDGSWKDGLDANGSTIPAFVATMGARFDNGVELLGSGFVKIQAYNAGAADATLTATLPVEVFDGQWHSFYLRGTDQGGFGALEALVDQLPGVNPNASVSGNIGKPRTFTIGGSLPAINQTIAGTAADNNAAQLQLSVGHVSYQDETVGLSSYFPSAFDPSGDGALQRTVRLARQEGIPAGVPGDLETVLPISAPMGPLQVDTVVNLFRSNEVTDRAVLVDRLGVLTHISLAYMVNRASLLTVDGASVHGLLGNRGQLPADFNVTFDDQRIINSVTAARADGGSQTVSDPRSIAAVGTYDGQLSLNARDDRAGLGQAGWSVHTGIERGGRFATLTVDLLRNPELIPAVLALLESKPDASDSSIVAGLDPTSGIGCRITVTNQPTATAPGDVDLQIRGWSMALRGRRGGWTITFNLVPYWPYEVFQIESDGGTGQGDGDTHNRHRIASGRDSTGASLSTVWKAVDTDDTVIPVLHNGGRFTWDETASGFGLLVDGEPVTVSSIAPYLKDDFTRTASSTLGSPDIGPGGAWNLDGTAANFATTGTVARITPSASGSDRTAYVNLSGSDAVLEVDARLVVLPGTSSGNEVGLVFRRANVGSGGNHDHIICELLVSGTTFNVMTVRILARTGGTLNVVATQQLPWSYVASQWVTILASVIGTTARVRAWPTFDAAGGRVNRWPNWQLSAEIGAFVPVAADNVGHGLIARTNDGNTTRQYEFDRYRMRTPQKLTVARSVNGVVRSHAVGSDVDLWHPAARSLGGRINEFGV